MFKRRRIAAALALNLIFVFIGFPGGMNVITAIVMIWMGMGVKQR